MKPNIVSAKEAAEMITDNSTITICGCNQYVVPEAILTALEKRFLETGKPNNLVDFHTVGVGRAPGAGLDHLAHEGLIRKTIGSSWDAAKLTKMIEEGKIEGHQLPMGVTYQLLRTLANGSKGYLTKVGLSVFPDPRVEGTALNEKTENNMVEIVEVDGEEYLFYKATPIDFAIIRGTTADTEGNISMEKEVLSLGIVAQALATKASGGKVIVQVERIAEAGTIPTRLVEIPGMLVDAVVVDPEQRQLLTHDGYDPSFAGEIKSPVPEISKVPKEKPARYILKRAAKEMEGYKVVNLGAGMPREMPRISYEEGTENEHIFTVEHGALGGVNPGGLFFALQHNPRMLIDSPSLFDLYDAGFLDISYLGFAEIDKEGNVNVSKFGGRVQGCGGFVDITYKTRKIVFCGTFTAGGLNASFVEDKVTINQEGKHQKFVDQVEQITFSAKNAIEKGQEIYYVTERCVFQLTNKGFELIEIAPGISVEEDILPHMRFKPIISEQLKTIDSCIYR
ncbi:acyl CoA:acetate/3-ketoacid CoA transferase [Oceanobacillus damuensis]|uniref:acyl CoA:acetate/3-ketoacid CoA transferase n=1 Tax=Oceanobacillus damuensis TaxID=937928 RepID=UPI00082AEBB0|nr:CoA-transferase [Oceanobacillus damuensis]